MPLKISPMEEQMMVHVQKLQGESPTEHEDSPRTQKAVRKSSHERGALRTSKHHFGSDLSHSFLGAFTRARDTAARDLDANVG